MSAYLANLLAEVETVVDPVLISADMLERLGYANPGTEIELHTDRAFLRLRGVQYYALVGGAS